MRNFKNLYQNEALEMLSEKFKINNRQKMKTIAFSLSLGILTLVSCNNSKNEVVEEFYSNGIIKTEIHVKDGMRNGITKNFDEKGRVVSSAEYKNDTLEGEMINYNPLNNKVTAKAIYKKNNQDGHSTLYYTDGSLYREMFYVDGHLDSIVKTYWADGKLQAENLFKMSDCAVGLKEWDKTGKEIEQPRLIVEKANKLANGYIQLRVYLSNKDKDVDFYSGDLKDGKFFNPEAIKLHSKDGVATMQFQVIRSKAISQRVNVFSKSRTELGNTLILSRTYDINGAN
jgi:antitoxin component YwqK of YwqJK toxin-antitoxin module